MFRRQSQEEKDYRSKSAAYGGCPPCDPCGGSGVLDSDSGCRPCDGTGIDIGPKGRSRLDRIRSSRKG